MPPAAQYSCVPAHLLALIVLFVAPACAAPGSGSVAGDTIRVSYVGSPNFGDVPSHLAHRRLRQRGFVVEETRYSGSDVAVEALARGNADIGMGSITAAWKAAARGAPIRTVMNHESNPHHLIAVSDVTSCADLEGRRLALHGEAGVGTDLVRAYLLEECPDVRPELMVILGSENRAAAFVAGKIDAAAIEFAVLHWLEERARGRFRVLARFADRWPAIKTTGVQVNTRFAAARPELLAEYLRARLEANRDLMASRERLVSEASLLLGASDRWPRVAAAYQTAGAWAPDGGLTEADVERTLAFFADAVGDMSPRQVADLSFLEEARAAGR